ncbi:phospholipid transfer protein C2CD2L isoform X2 [Latimeria chalumnae]|uniref:phospholipid transfer protein C2CD2L isoform X2 n=1 Tax=Latimeria chalumnae TaxID=7897 RepID=UPI00313C6F7F
MAVFGVGIPASVGDLGWLILLLLFVISLVTVLTWLVQYTRGIWRRRVGRVLDPDPSRAAGVWRSLLQLGFGARGSVPEAGVKGLIASLFAFKSFRDNWQKVWINALNEQACRIGSSVQITFEESPQLMSSSSVSQVTCMDQSERSMVLQCHVSADAVRFPVSVTQQSPAAVSMDTYQVSLTLQRTQLEICMEEVENEGLLVSWTFRERPNLSVTVSPKLQQREENDGKVDVSTIQELIEDTIVSTQPAMVINLKASASSVMAAGDKVSKHSASLYKSALPMNCYVLVKQLKALNVPWAKEGGSGMLFCAVELDSPQRLKHTRSVLASQNGSSELEWNEDICLELGAETRELRVKILESSSAGEAMVIGHTVVLLDPLSKQPVGRQVYLLKSKGISPESSAGTISFELVYQDSGDHKTTPPVAPSRTTITPTKKVEMDRTIMPDGTIVTTVTTIQSRPRMDCKLDSPSRSPSKVEVTENKSTVLTENSSANVTPTTSAESRLSNGVDPVAETAIRQLTEGTSKATKKTPTKRSTLIISGISKVPISQDEMSLSMGYAASMDASLQGDASGAGRANHSQNSAESLRSNESPNPGQRVSQELDDTTRSDISERPSVEDVESETGSTGALETRSLKDHKVGFLRSGTKLLFRRKHKQKDPGLSQSHDDLANTSSATSSRKKSGSFSRRLIKRFSFKSRSKSKSITNGGATASEN